MIRSWLRAIGVPVSPPLRRFHSHDEFFRAVDDLLTTLESKGHVDAVIELRDGLGCLNGLTDGWALFLESIERVRAASDGFAEEDRRALKAIRAAVRRIVYGYRG